MKCNQGVGEGARFNFSYIPQWSKGQSPLPNCQLFSFIDLSVTKLPLHNCKIIFISFLVSIEKKLFIIMQGDQDVVFNEQQTSFFHTSVHGIKGIQNSLVSKNVLPNSTSEQKSNPCLIAGYFHLVPFLSCNATLAQLQYIFYFIPLLCRAHKFSYKIFFQFVNGTMDSHTCILARQFAFHFTSQYRTYPCLVASYFSFNSKVSIEDSHAQCQDIYHLDMSPRIKATTAQKQDLTFNSISQYRKNIFNNEN